MCERKKPLANTRRQRSAACKKTNEYAHGKRSLNSDNPTLQIHLRVNVFSPEKKVADFTQR